jgi:invasion protein IalB
LQVQALNLQGQWFDFPIPLADFKKANDGGPIEPRLLDDERRKTIENSAAAQPSPNPNEPLLFKNMPQLVFTPWIKMCGKGPDVCVTQRAATTEMGLPMVQAALIEAEGKRKSLTVMVPVGVVVAKGARITIDQDQPIGSPFSTCFTNGCIAQFEASNDTIAKLKAGQSLLVQAVALPNLVMNMAVPLSDFKKANEGPPTEPKVAEEQQKKFQEELQKRAQEARKSQAR